MIFHDDQGDQAGRNENAALQAQIDDRNAWCDHLAARESALLLAVPRPFRTFVHRRAERIQRKLEAQ